jgi:hypothetical protein
MLIHANHLWRMRDGDVGGETAARKLEEQRLVAAQDQLIDWMLTCPAQGAWHDLSGPVVSAHRVESEADPALR